MEAETSVAIDPSPELVRFAKWQAIHAPLHSRTVEARLSQRQVLAVPAVVQPMDSELEPLGDPFGAVTREISQHGLSLIVGGLSIRRDASGWN